MMKTLKLLFHYFIKDFQQIHYQDGDLHSHLEV
jgi:hypothetical protein